jgi:RNA polymerase sigma factor (sigma-70 family)
VTVCFVNEAEDRELPLNVDELCHRIRTGDKKAREELFAFLSERFLCFARRKISSREDAAEVVQEALAAVAMKMNELPGEANVFGWAHRVLNIQVLRYYRKRYGDDRKLDAFRDSRSHTGAWEPDPAFRRTLQECLARVARQNNRYARVLNLHYQGYSVDEVCQMLGVTRNNYYVILSRARAMLEECLDSQGALG